MTAVRGEISQVSTSGSSRILSRKNHVATRKQRDGWKGKNATNIRSVRTANLAITLLIRRCARYPIVKMCLH